MKEVGFLIGITAEHRIVRVLLYLDNRSASYVTKELSEPVLFSDLYIGGHRFYTTSFNDFEKFAFYNDMSIEFFNSSEFRSVGTIFTIPPETIFNLSCCTVASKAASFDDLSIRSKDLIVSFDNALANGFVYRPHYSVDMGMPVEQFPDEFGEAVVKVYETDQGKEFDFFPLLEGVNCGVYNAPKSLIIDFETLPDYFDLVFVGCS